MRIRSFLGVAVLPALAFCVGLRTVASAEVVNREMLVTASRTTREVNDIPASARLLDREMVKLLNPIATDELFRGIGGVDLQGSGFPGSEIKLNLRGLTPGYQSKRVLVLVDGRRINDQYQGNVDFTLLPADSIERVELVRGPASALYGSSAMAGVINIITRPGPDDPLTQVKASAGSYGLQHYRLIHGATVGPVDYFFTGSHVETDGYMNNTDGTDRDWRADNVTANLGVALGDAGSVRVSSGFYGAAGTDENSDRKSAKDYQSASYEYHWGSTRTSTARLLAYRNGEHHVYDWKYPGRGIYRQQTLSADCQVSIWLGSRNQLTAGVEGRGESVDISEVAGDIDEHTTTASVYVQDEVFVTDWLELILGLRGDYNTDFDDELSPRIGLLWRPTDWSEVFASVNRAHRAPGLSDRFVRIAFGGMVFEGNPELNPERLTACEVGARARIAQRGSCEVSVFDNRLEDGFDFMLDPSDGVFRNRNVNEIRTYGVEVGVEWRFPGDTAVFANYSFCEGEYEEFPGNPAVEGNQLAYLARDKASVGVSFPGPLKSRHSLGGRYVGRRYGNAQNTDAGKMNDYIVVDWRSRIPIGDHVDVTVNVDNLFDEDYRDFPAYDQPGTMFVGGLEVTF